MSDFHAKQRRETAVKGNDLLVEVSDVRLISSALSRAIRSLRCHRCIYYLVLMDLQTRQNFQRYVTTRAAPLTSDFKEKGQKIDVNVLEKHFFSQTDRHQHRLFCTLYFSVRFPLHHSNLFPSPHSIPDTDTPACNTSPSPSPIGSPQGTEARICSQP